MTRQDVVRHLRGLMDASADDRQAIRLIDEEPDGRLVIEAEGERYEITVSPTEQTDDAEVKSDDALRAAFGRSIDDAAQEAKRDGAVPADELRQSLDNAIARGSSRWAARQRLRD